MLLFALPNRNVADGDVLPHLLYYQNFLYVFRRAHDAALGDVVAGDRGAVHLLSRCWFGCCRCRAAGALRGAIVALIGLRLWLVEQGLERTHFLTPCRLDTLAAGATSR